MTLASTPWRCDGCETWNEATATSCVVCDEPASPMAHQPPPRPTPADIATAGTAGTNSPAGVMRPHVSMHASNPAAPTPIPPSVAAMVANAAELSGSRPAVSRTVVAVVVAIAVIAVALFIGVLMAG